jgi:hypothetical protein
MSLLMITPDASTSTDEHNHGKPCGSELRTPWVNFLPHSPDECTHTEFSATKGYKKASFRKLKRILTNGETNGKQPFIVIYRFSINGCRYIR